MGARVESARACEGAKGWAGVRVWACDALITPLESAALAICGDVSSTRCAARGEQRYISGRIGCAPRGGEVGGRGIYWGYIARGVGSCIARCMRCALQPLWWVLAACVEKDADTCSARGEGVR